MPKLPQALFLSFALLLAACGSSLTDAPAALRAPFSKDTPLPRPQMQVAFQQGQTVTIKLAGKNGPLENQFVEWVREGVYSNAFVYRQLPGVFILAGKPRLQGLPFVDGREVENLKKQPQTHYGSVGLIVHADGTVGPEMILYYGWSVRECCQTPANVRIGTITSGQSLLAKVQRGDVLTNIAIQP